MPTPSTFHLGCSSPISTSMLRRRSATASVRPAMPPPTTRTFLMLLTEPCRQSFRLQLRRLDDIAEALVIAAHARAELLRRFLETLQTTIGKTALHLRMVLHRMDMLHQRGDDRRR